MKKLRLVSLFFLAACFLAACSISLAEDLTPPPDAQAPVSAPLGEAMGATSPMSGSTSSSGPVYPVVNPDPAKGKAIYAEKCAPCHGDKGMGDGPRAAQLSVPVAEIGNPALARLATPASWFNMVTNGNIERFMPPFINGLDDRQRWDVVAYAFSLSQTPEMLAAAETLYTQECAQCHGDTGLGDGPEAGSARPRSFHDLEFMATQPDQALFDAITNGAADVMKPYNQLSEDERWGLVAYVRNLPYAAPGESAAAPVVTPLPAAETGSITTTLPVSGTGVINVTINMPGGQPLPENVEVVLYAFDNMTLSFTTTESTQQGTVFTFENVVMPAERAFIASAEFNGVTYGSDVALPTPGQPIELVVQVYETTTDKSGLVIDRLHMFFDFTAPDLVQVVEVYVFLNPGDKTITSEEPGGPVAQFIVPEGAINVQFQDGQMGQKYLEIPGGFADTTPIRAGETGYQVMFAFDLPYKDAASFSQQLVYDVNSSIILLPDNGVKLKSDALKEGTPQAIQGANYKVYNSEVLKQGSSMTIELSGKPSDAPSDAAGGSGLTADETQNSLLIGLSVLGLALVLVGVWLWRRERKPAVEADEEDEEEDGAPEDDLDDADSLMDAIISLDDQFKSGQISQEAYQQRRAELKSRLQQRME